jgi:hypothetical protein
MVFDKKGKKLDPKKSIFYGLNGRKISKTVRLKGRT